MKNDNKSLFKVWCKTKNEWKKGAVALLHTGELFDIDDRVILESETHLLCRSTNVMDINRNIIYENYLVMICGSDEIYKVVFVNGIFKFIPINSNLSIRNADRYYRGCEIVGNVFENNELLVR